MQIEIWTPVGVRDDITGKIRQWDGAAIQPSESFYPDIPVGISFTSDEALPTDYSSEKGLPACSSFNIIIDEKDIPAIEAHLKLTAGDLVKQQPKEADKLMVEMIRACRGDWDRKADAFFDSIPMDAADDARKTMVVSLVEQARLRPDGIAATKALAIADRLELDVAVSTEIKP